jgi:hypothetical protein
MELTSLTIATLAPAHMCQRDSWHRRKVVGFTATYAHADVVCWCLWSGRYQACGAGTSHRSHYLLLIMRVVRAPLHLLEIVWRELFLHLTHFSTQRVDVLVGIAFSCFEWIIFKEKFFQLMGCIKVGFLLL